MGYYSTLIAQKPVKTSLTEKEFFEKWEKAKESLAGDKESEGYLDMYNWEVWKRDGEFTWYYLEMEEFYAKHYADEALAVFISEVIADGEKCLLEFCGEDGFNWGYYITKGSVKDIEYVKMVDGKPIE